MTLTILDDTGNYREIDTATASADDLQQAYTYLLMMGNVYLDRLVQAVNALTDGEDREFREKKRAAILASVARRRKG